MGAPGPASVVDRLRCIKPPLGDANAAILPTPSATRCDVVDSVNSAVPAPGWLKRSWLQFRSGSARRLALLGRWYWLAPLLSIILFIAVMLAVFYALREDELDRQQQTLYRDTDVVQQAIRARLSTNQEDLIQLSHEFSAAAGDELAFLSSARAILRVHPALMSVAWVDTERVWRRVVSSDVQFDGGPREEGDAIENAVSRVAYESARERRTPVYSAPYAAADGDMYIELHVPLYENNVFEGTVVSVTSLASLMRNAVTKDSPSRYSLSLTDGNGAPLARTSGVSGPTSAREIQRGAITASLPLGYPLSDIYLRAAAYRTRSNLADNFLVWAVVALSALIVWTLISQMRHLRGRHAAEAARDRIFNLSLDILAEFDHRGRITRLNPACERILGRNPADLRGASLLDLAHPDDRAATERELKRISEGGVSSAFENRCRRFNPDGTIEYRWLVWNFNPDLRTRSDKRLLYAVAHDVTQRRARQQALQAETSFRRAMENSMLTGMRVLDMNGRITYVNPAFCRMLGYAEHELLDAEPPFPYWRVEDRAQSDANMADMLAGRVPPSGLEVRVRRADGTELDTRMYVSPLIDANGVQSGWMTSMTDITQSKRARVELAAAQERFTTVLDELDAAVSVCAIHEPTDTPAPLLFANRCYRRLFGGDEEGHLELDEGRAQAVTINVDDDDDQPSSEVFSVHASRWFDVRSRIIQWVDGSTVRMQVATDITARVATRDRERQQEEKVQLTSRLITMGEMASSLAHELNQPLTAISNYSMGTVARVRRNIASGTTTDPVELLGMLQKTSAQAERAGHIIRRIREFVKRSEPRKRLVRIRAIVDDAVGFAEIEASKKRITIRTDVPSDIADIEADAILIEQVLLNLIRNGYEAMIEAAAFNPGVRLREIVVSVRDLGGDGAQDGMTRSSGLVEFAVADRGPGIPVALQEQVFEPFFSTKAEGMGMGLKICRSIVEFHRGRLWASPHPDGGTIFRFTLPRSTAPIANEPLHETAATAGGR